VRPKARWACLTAKSATLTNTTVANECQTSSGHIPRNQPEKGIDSYGEKDFEKRKVLRWKWKTTRAMSTSVYDHSLMIEKSWWWWWCSRLIRNMKSRRKLVPQLPQNMHHYCLSAGTLSYTSLGDLTALRRPPTGI